MRRAASAAANLLPDPAGVAEFLRSQANPDGGFRDRAGQSDLYYTVFGLEAMAALGLPPPANTAAFLRRFDRIDQLDFVHLNCLARCWGHFPAEAPDAPTRQRMLGRIEQSRTADGGYTQWPGTKNGTAYGCILALGAYQDLGQSPDAECRAPSEVECAASRLAAGPKVRASHVAEMPSPEGLLACLRSLRAADGGYVNEPGQSTGLTPATAAAVTVQMELGQLPDADAVAWLLARHQRDGGFAAMPSLPLADLLSTATALHALARAGASIDAIRRRCLRFVLGLWADGGFRGHAFDDVRDCEYTFYGLLALGHLAT
ncbi:MAG: prenyltransferase/squalene oxidase repeat-containing protein [Phycisphaerae bacterium]|nr:prenyltransferase/squalene oxidase repeat-containing protein [Phycisphaerae bacterium]